MQNNQVIHDIRQFFNSEKQNGKNLITYQTKLDFDVFLDKYDPEYLYCTKD